MAATSFSVEAGGQDLSRLIIPFVRERSVTFFLGAKNDKGLYCDEQGGCNDAYTDHQRSGKSEH